MKTIKLIVDFLSIIALVCILGLFFSTMIQSLFYIDFNPRDDMVTIMCFVGIIACLRLIQMLLPAKHEPSPYNDLGTDVCETCLHYYCTCDCDKSITEEEFNEAMNSFKDDIPHDDKNDAM